MNERSTVAYIVRNKIKFQIKRFPYTISSADEWLKTLKQQHLTIKTHSRERPLVIINFSWTINFQRKIAIRFSANLDSSNVKVTVDYE